MIYKVCECEYCGEENQITRPTPFMADRSAMMCEYCWNDTKQEYEASEGVCIPEFESEKEDYEKIKQELEEQTVCGSPYSDLWVGIKFQIQSSEYCKEIREQDYAPAFGSALCEKCVEKECKFIKICIEHNEMQMRDLKEND